MINVFFITLMGMAFVAFTTAFTGFYQAGYQRATLLKDKEVEFLKEKLEFKEREEIWGRS